MPRKAAAIAALALLVLFGLHRISHHPPPPTASPPEKSLQEATDPSRTIRDVVKRGETMFDIFQRHGMSVNDLYPIREASAGVHRLKSIHEGQPYTIELDGERNVVSLSYQIDGDAVLLVTREDPGFHAEKVRIPYETRTRKIGGVIESNLYDALGVDGNRDLLACALSDIFSWDIDFTTDLRKGDTFKVVVEEQWLEGEFKRFGNVLAAEFTNDGTTYRGFRYEAPDGRAGYYDEEGRSLQRAFLKAPLSYRRISSGFSRSRMHPILKIRRPHLGVDYVAPRGTPVSALGDGTVRFAAYKGANGKLVILRHPKGFTTYYGHLSAFRRGIRRGSRVSQGDVIGYVGATGRATGPHLDFRIKRGNRFINPLRVDIPRGGGIPKSLRGEFDRNRRELGLALASIIPSRPGTGPGHAVRTAASER
ncbi:MAG TPA: peptidoglycan DD-metalloendopeptidase family protein [Candidatus Aquicultoraceae bacterium]|nr:peptidoglycan DD-metalloendopeptidase family protein [Candidatus Aquicultoraceae bacterium]